MEVSTVARDMATGLPEGTGGTSRNPNSVDGPSREERSGLGALPTEPTRTMIESGYGTNRALQDDVAVVRARLRVEVRTDPRGDPALALIDPPAGPVGPMHRFFEPLIMGPLPRIIWPRGWNPESRRPMSGGQPGWATSSWSGWVPGPTRVSTGDPPHLRSSVLP